MEGNFIQWRLHARVQACIRTFLRRVSLLGIFALASLRELHARFGFTARRVYGCCQL